jgi:hypothetical protein
MLSFDRNRNQISGSTKFSLNKICMSRCYSNKRMYSIFQSISGSTYINRTRSLSAAGDFCSRACSISSVYRIIIE